jgi:hypothetical protein
MTNPGTPSFRDKQSVHVFIGDQEPTQDDQECLTIEDFLRLVLRLTGERLTINISIKAHFMQLGVNPDLYEVSLNASPSLSFNLGLR